MAFCCGRWISVSGTDLVPGDVVSVSIMGRQPEEHLSYKRDKQNVLFCGTKILQHTPDKTFHMKTPDDGCLAFVLRTGFETKQGRLIQTILVSRDTVSANSWERGLFSLLFVVFAIISASYQFKEGLEDPNWSRHKLLSKSSLIVTSLIPPGLPKELWLAVLLSWVELRRRDIFFVGAFGIPNPGKHTGDRSSMVSPSVTAKYPSVSITRYLIRERRTTLVTTLQMLKILGLHCFAFIYVQCIMHLNGVKLGDVLTLISYFFTTNFILSISDTRPLSSACRRHHPHVLLSMLGQSALHMLLLILSVKEAKKHMPIEPEPEFESNMAITVSFIASMTIQVTTFAVNYLGHPLNECISENKQFKCVLLSAVVFLAVITSSVSRNFNDLLMLVPLQSGLRDKLIIWGALMFFGCYTWEWLLSR
ncbi:probable manganese-transporting ATPase PDR2 [Tanacetum coccineum]